MAKRFTYEVPDYEHWGDLAWGEAYVRKCLPFATIERTYEERDYEREYDYRSEYGDCDESFFQGYVEFSVPEDKAEETIKFLYN